MLPSTDIDETLLYLDFQYQAIQKMGGGKKFVNIYCKIGLIELCGWIEQAMDEVIHASSARTGCTDLAWLSKETENTYSFHYEEAFRPLLYGLIGQKQYEAMELALNGKAKTAFPSMKALLSTLKKPRNIHAHSHLLPATEPINTPSTLRGHQKTIAAGLSEIEMYLTGIGH